MRKSLTLKLALILTLAIAACGAIVQQSSAADNISIDEKAFKKALSNWTDYRDRVIGKFSEMSQEEADEAYFDEDSELNKMWRPEELEALDESIRPVLSRYLKMLDTIPLYPDMLKLDAYIEALGENDREVLALVVNSGLIIVTSEGDSYLIPDHKFLRGLIKHRLSGDAQAYMAAADLEPPSFYSDGGLAYSVEEMGDWAVAWETFISEHPDNRHKERAAERYGFFIAIPL
jgi:vacuolar-type H+-ATPase subunit E/Vma4